MEAWEITLEGLLGATLAKGLCYWVKKFGSVSAGVEARGQQWGLQRGDNSQGRTG